MIRGPCPLKVLAGHAFLVLIESLVNSLSAESWNLFFSFFLDLPISIIFHSLLEGVAIENQFLVLLGMHVLLGGMWWVVVFCGGLKLISWLRQEKE